MKSFLHVSFAKIKIKEPISKLIPKRKREEIVADNFFCTGEERGKRPEAQRRCVEDDFPLMTLYAAISASCSREKKRF
ncbi:MAG: hypothetical protein M0Z58_00060 [Nitrospiraceae bacterium]|nr:hypothetical protein [Nitrospiraceae bacterium]